MILEYIWLRYLKPVLKRMFLRQRVRPNLRPHPRPGVPRLGFPPVGGLPDVRRISRASGELPNPRLLPNLRLKFTSEYFRFAAAAAMD